MKDRDERCLFSLTLQLMSGQKVIRAPVAVVCLKEPSQQQLPPRFQSTFIVSHDYSRGLSAL